LSSGQSCLALSLPASGRAAICLTLSNLRAALIQKGLTSSDIAMTAMVYW